MIPLINDALILGSGLLFKYTFSTMSIIPRIIIKISTTKAPTFHLNKKGYCFDYGNNAYDLGFSLCLDFYIECDYFIL